MCFLKLLVYNKTTKAVSSEELHLQALSFILKDLNEKDLNETLCNGLWRILL